MNREIKELADVSNTLSSEKLSLKGCLNELCDELDRSKKEINSLQEECFRKQQEIC